MTARECRRILLCYLPLGALAIAATAYFTQPERCTCALGRYYQADYSDPADCAFHGAMTE